MSWIWQNKVWLFEWLFSGVGVTLVVFVCNWLYRFLHREDSQRMDHEAVRLSQGLVPLLPRESYYKAETFQFPPARFTKPTPNEIREAVEAVPPFQQPAVASSYRGLKVCWPALFRSIEPETPNKTGSKNAAKNKKKLPELPSEWMVHLKHYQDIGYSPEYIFCYGIRLDSFPKLKIAHHNEAVVVSGTVAHVSGYDVHLVDVDIEFT